MAAAAVL
jgi:hypothetical protein